MTIPRVLAWQEKEKEKASEKVHDESKKTRNEFEMRVIERNREGWRVVERRSDDAVIEKGEKDIARSPHFPDDYFIRDLGGRLRVVPHVRRTEAAADLPRERQGAGAEDKVKTKANLTSTMEALH